MKIIIITLLFFSSGCLLSKDKYNRQSFGYYPYKTSSKVGFYTKKICTTNIDHVVSLKDAHESGAYKWNRKQKKKFSNDKQNHVACCYKINSSKGSGTPKTFLTRSKDKKGLDFDIINFCEYLNIYHTIKTKYNLSFKNNNANLFSKCSIDIVKKND